MEISELFYLSGVIFFIFFSVLMVFVAYQLHVALKDLRSGFKTAKRTFVALGAARFTFKSAILRTVIGLLGGGETNERDE